MNKFFKSNIVQSPIFYEIIRQILYFNRFFKLLYLVGAIPSTPIIEVLIQNNTNFNLNWNLVGNEVVDIRRLIIIIEVIENESNFQTQISSLYFVTKLSSLNHF